MATVEVDALKTEITNLETNIKSSVADKFTTSMVESEGNIDGCKTKIETNATENSTAAKTAVDAIKAAVDSTATVSL